MNYYNDRIGGHGIYRSRRGILGGVCRGLAEYFDVSVFWTRVFTFLAFWITGCFPTLFLYVLAVMLMKKEPYLRWN